MNKKILVSLIFLSLAAILAIGGTIAYFGDVETSRGNSFTAGSVDLKVGDNCLYNEELVQDCAWQATDLTNELFFNFKDIKPGDSGSNSISLRVNDNQSWVCAKIDNLKDFENGCNDPETKIGDMSCGDSGEGQGELQDVLKFTVWNDTDCDNRRDAGEVVLAVDQPAKAGNWAIADKNTGTGPLTEACVGIEWNVSTLTGNIIQTDSLTGSLSFFAEQARNNNNFICDDQNVCGNGIVDEGEECDTNDIIYKGWGYHCNADCTIKKCTAGQGRPCRVQTSDDLRQGLQWCVEDGFWGDCELESIFEYYNIGDNDVNSVVDPKWEAQTFTPQTTHRITKVKIKIYRMGLPGTVTFGIRATDAEGKPWGADLASGSIDGNSFTDNLDGDWYEIDLGVGAVLEKGVKYAIVLGNNAAGWARWRVATTSNYDGGTCATSFDSGNTWVLCDYDTMFEEWGVETVNHSEDAVVQDDFNAYADGSVVGQGGWASYSNGENFIVQDFSFVGARSIYIGAPDDNVIYKPGLPRASGRQVFHIRTSDRSSWGNLADGNVQVRISEGPWPHGYSFCAVSLKKDGNVAYYDPGIGVYKNFASYNDNEWVKIEIEWRTSDKMARYKVDDGVWTNWSNFTHTSSFVNFNYVGLAFDMEGGSAGGVYFDNLY